MVRRARADEPMTLLDGNEVKPKETTLVIADAKGPACMAGGIFGGDRTGVSETTTDILLECAFAPLSITGRARTYGLHTDSSHRFGAGWIPSCKNGDGSCHPFAAGHLRR